MKNDHLEELWALIGEFEKAVRKDLSARVAAWNLDLSRTQEFEVAGGLLARQFTLAIQIARSPEIWNMHAAPVLLRCMVDVYITLAWILKAETPKRARDYVQYGLGQSKLTLEHLKAKAAELAEPDKEMAEYLQNLDAWQERQQFQGLTEVNVGNWAGENMRVMAEQAECKEKYTFAFTPYSAAVHSMWHHIAKANLEICGNQLHRHHRVPVIPQSTPDAHLLFQAARLSSETTTLFDTWAKTEKIPITHLKALEDGLEALGGRRERRSRASKGKTAKGEVRKTKRKR